MADDVLINKAAAIERAVRRVREEYAGDDANLAANQTRQDSIILNLLKSVVTKRRHDNANVFDRGRASRY